MNERSNVLNSYSFVDEIKNITVCESDILVSYDVVSLYTKVPVKESLTCIRAKLETDDTLSDRTNLTVDEIVKACALCLGSTYFTFQNTFYHQTEGLPMGSPLSPIVANIFMENFEEKAISSFHRPPKIWKRYVDDTFVVISKFAARTFFAHLNSQNQAIKFTAEYEKLEGTLPFLDCLIVRDPDGKLQTTVYRKPTNTGRYMQFNSSHSLSTKRGFIKGLFLRAQRICSTENLLLKENSTIISELQMNGYPLKLIKSVMSQGNATRKEWTKTISIPYVPGKSEAIRRILNKVNIQVALSSQNPLGKALSKVKDDIPMEDQGNLIYKLSCNDCDAVYVGETSRALADRIREHRALHTKFQKIWLNSPTWKEVQREPFKPLNTRTASILNNPKFCQRTGIFTGNGSLLSNGTLTMRKLHVTLRKSHYIRPGICYNTLFYDTFL